MDVQGGPLFDSSGLVTAPELMGGLPTMGALTDTYILDDPPESIVEIRTGRFPTPPVAWAFLLDPVDSEGEPIYHYEGLSWPHVVVGAVYPESAYLEPTIGQIWPRTG